MCLREREVEESFLTYIIKQGKSYDKTLIFVFIKIDSRVSFC